LAYDVSTKEHTVSTNEEVQWMYRNLKAEIARAGMTTCECAEAAGVSLGTFYRLLNGSSEWKLDEMLKLSQAIAMKNGHAGLDYLFGGDSDGTT
jgi:predicted transcriptional regulator